jgi:hypothetical protein
MPRAIFGKCVTGTAASLGLERRGERVIAASTCRVLEKKSNWPKIHVKASRLSWNAAENTQLELLQDIVQSHMACDKHQQATPISKSRP